MPRRSRLGREVLIYLGGFAAVGLIQFLALPFYSRALGPEQFGLYTLAMATTTALAGVMVVGGDVALARFWADDQDDAARRTLASTWILFLTLWSVVLAALACVASPWIAAALKPDGSLLVLLLLGFAAMVPTQLSRMLSQILRNSFRPGAYTAMLVLNAALDVAFGLLFAIALDLGVAGILLGILVGETLGAVVRLPLVRPFLAWTFEPALLSPLLRFGVPFVPASLAAWTLKGADRLALGAHATAAELGYYGLAAALVAPFALVTSSLAQAWVPRISQTHQQDVAAARRATSQAIVWSLAAFGAASMLLGALAPVLIVVVGGPAFAAGAEVVPLLGLGAAFAGMGLFCATGMTLAKATRAIPAVTGIAAVLNVALLLVLVPVFGGVGAAFSVAFANLALALLSLRSANRVFPLSSSRGAIAVIVLALSVQAAVCTVRAAPLAVAATTLLAMAATGTAAWLVRPRQAAAPAAPTTR
jgi:O-antigen/teichoic acid export membrane protein